MDIFIALYTCLTREELCLLPNNGKRHEIVEGDLLLIPASPIVDAF